MAKLVGKTLLATESVGGSHGCKEMAAFMRLP